MYLFIPFCVHHTWNPISNGARLFHTTAAPDIAYIVFNIVEIFVYKVQWRLIFLWSAHSRRSPSLQLLLAAQTQEPFCLNMQRTSVLLLFVQFA